MGKPLSLTAKDAHRLGAYRADPEGKPRGGIVVVQEIFGVNHHIRSVCDRLAALGYSALAPALFDRFARDFQSGYSPDEIAQARKLLANVDWAAFVRDTTAAVEALPRPVAVMGFCMGGTVAYLAARLQRRLLHRFLTMLTAALLIILIGISRVYLGVHYPSDVIAGVIIGIAWAGFCMATLEAIQLYARNRAPRVLRHEQLVPPHIS